MPINLEFNSFSVTQEELYRLSFENAAVGIAHVNKDEYFLNVNHKVAEITGYKEDELLLKTFLQITHPDDIDRDYGKTEALLRGDIKAYNIEKRCIRKDGITIWITVNRSAVIRADGEFLMYVDIMEDITEKKLKQEKLVGKQQHLNNILNSITDCYVVMDKEWKIIEVNKQAERNVFQIPATELTGKVIWDLYPNRAGDIFRRELERAFRENVSVHFDVHSTVADKWFEVHAFPDSSLIEVFFRDITDRKILEDALFKSDKKFADLFFNSPAFTVISDVETGEVIETNEAYSKITGYFS